MLVIPRPRTRRLVALYATALALVLAACGGDDKSSSCELPESSAGAPGNSQEPEGSAGAPAASSSGTGGNGSSTPSGTGGSSTSSTEGSAGTETENPFVPQAGSGNTDPVEPETGETPPEDTEGNTEVPELDVVTFPKVGATEFETATEEPSSSGDSWATRNTSAVGASGAMDDAAETAAPSEEAADPSNSAADSGAEAATREIVEADIVQMNGNILYVLNSYRGLVLIDMTDPDAPFVSGRVPFQATPVDMYLRDGRAYIVMSDYFTYWQFDSDADPLGFHGSRILVVDVDDPKNPKSITGYNVEGEVTDTRIVGDVLYVVSHRNPDYWRYDTNDWEDTTWVLSINVADPDAIHEVDRETFPGASQIIQVFPDSIAVAAVDPNYYITDDVNTQQTLITNLDISDPAGDIVVGGTAYVPGMVPDKFKMDLYDGHLRIVSNNWRWEPEAPATLTVFDVSNPSEMNLTAQIPVAGDVPDQDTYVRPAATRFDETKLFVNLCWYVYTNNRSRQVCRLDLYDLGDPTAPAKVGDIPAAGTVTHFEPRGDRLIALGTHIVNETNWTSQVRLELYDVSNLAATTSLSAVDIGDEYSSSEALNDYKALKVLDDLNMILLPLNWTEITGTDNNGNDIRVYHQGAQIVDWQNDALAERGRVAQQGAVTRAIAFQDRVISISDKQVQVIDAADRDNPVATASVFLVRNIVDVFDMNGYAVQLGYDEEDSSFRFFVLPFGEDDLAESVAELEIGNNVYMHLRKGDIVRLIGYDSATGRQKVRNVDFSDPTQPTWRGELLVPEEIGSIVTNYSGRYYGGYWGYYNYYWSNMVGKSLDNDLFPVLVRNVVSSDTGRRNLVNLLKIVDLTDADNPRVTDASIEFPDYPFVNVVNHGNVLYSMHTEPALDAEGNEKKYHVRYFVDRIDVSDPDEPVQLETVNIPGVPVDVDESGQILYTVDYQWDDFGRRRNSFNVVNLSADSAELLAVLPVGDEIGRARYMDRVVWLSSHRYPWYGLNEDSADSRQPYTKLTRVSVDDAGIVSDVATNVSGYHFDLLDVEQDLAYLASSYPTGLLVLDVSDMEAPRIVSAARTIGYVSKIVRHEDMLYMPMGPYGVRTTPVGQ